MELIEPVAWRRCELINKAEQAIAANGARPMERPMTPVTASKIAAPAKRLHSNATAWPISQPSRATPTATLAEIFINNSKAGSQSDAAAKDAAVVCSIALQFGVPLERDPACAVA